MPKKKAEKSLDQLLEEALVKKDDQPYEVPENWEWVKLGTVSKINMGQSPKSTFVDNNPNNIPLIGGPKDMGEIFPNISRYTNKPTKLSEVGDLIITIRATLGKTNFSDRKYCLGRGVASLTPHKTEINYLKNYFTTIEGYLYEISTGTTFSQISKQDLVDLQFPLPSLPEQERIDKKLSSMLGRLKEARELIQEARDTFEESRAAILNKAFTGELTKKWREENPDVENTFIEINEVERKPYTIPVTWKWIEFGHLTKETKLGLVRSVKEQSDTFKYFYLKMNNITIDGTLDLNDIARVTSSEHEVETYCLKEGDLLFNTRNSYELVGKNTVFQFPHKENILFNNNIMRIRFLPDVSPKLISFFLNSSIGKSLLNQIKKCTTNVAAIYAKNLNTIPVALSPKEEQKEIVRILEKLLNHEDEARALIDMEEQIDLIEKSILSKAFRGELGTNDPDDEPAIELLKRSLKEKEKAA